MSDLLRKSALVCLLSLAASACDSGQKTPSDTPAGTMSGRERLVWDQHAPDANELSQYSYVLYIDGRAVDLPGSACGALAGQGPTAACSSPLPPLQNGQHSLELATRVTRDGEVVESVRSVLLVVTVGGSASSASASATAPTSELRVSSAEPYVVEKVVSGLDRPSALAAFPDGRLLIAERGGRLRIVEDGRLLDAPALELTNADSDDEAAVSLAIARDFASTRHVYVSYSARDAGTARIGRVVRYREVGGTLGEPAVIVDGLPGKAGAPRVGIGPDDAVYVGTASIDTGEAGDMSSYAGKILRFTKEGTTPPDNPIRSSPVFSLGHRGQLGFDWDPESGSLWYIDADDAGMTLGRANSGRRGEGIADLGRIRATSMAFHAGAWLDSWRGSLFLASPDGECLYRVAGLAASPYEPVVERLFAARFGRISAVTSGTDGLYFVTGNGGLSADGAPPDAVYRIR